MDFLGFPWVCVDFNGVPWPSIEFHGVSWTSQTSGYAYNINDMGYVMAVVRNPYDRAVSGYKYLQWRLENRMFERFKCTIISKIDCSNNTHSKHNPGDRNK